MDRDHLVDEVSRIKHRNSNNPLDDELRLEQVLTFLGQTLQRERGGGQLADQLAVPLGQSNPPLLFPSRRLEAVTLGVH